jgi:hypothetical protein
MMEQTVAGGIDPNSVRKVVSVQAPPGVAWRVFTEEMATWWPLATKRRTFETTDRSVGGPTLLLARRYW